MVIIGLQIIILRKKFKPIAFIQIPVVFLFGVMSDWTLDMLSGITYTTYWQQWIYCGIGVVVVGLGVCMEVNSRVATMAGEGLVLAICSIKTISVGNMKIIFDCSLVASAVVVSLVATHGLIGVREGTVASMLLVGTFVKIFNKPISKLAGNKD